MSTGKYSRYIRLATQICYRSIAKVTSPYFNIGYINISKLFQKSFKINDLMLLSRMSKMPKVNILLFKNNVQLSQVTGHLDQ